MKRLPINAVTGITLVVLTLVAAVIYAVLFDGKASETLKTTVVQSVLLALAAVTGYWLNSSADQAKKEAPPEAPSTTTTTTTTKLEEPKGDKPDPAIPDLANPRN